jgi:uncharacterized protein
MIRSRFLAVAAAASLPWAGTAQVSPERSRTVSVGSASAGAGTIAYGVLPVPPGRDPGYQIPVTVINGTRAGPRIALVAGLHGAEFAGIVALQKLASALKPDQIAGSVVIIPVANVAGFEQRAARVNPVDGKNMNRFFPGSPVGTQTERASHVLARDVLEQADYVIDYHGGDIDEDQHPYSYWIRSADSRVTESGRQMVAAFGLPYIIEFPLTDLGPGKTNLLPTHAIARGKPTITVDAGRAGTYTDEDIALLVDGTKRTLRRLGMLIDGGPVPLRRQAHVTAQTLNSPATGLFFPAVRRGQRVTKGQTLGRVADFYGKDLATVVAPANAVILYLNATPSAVQGQQLFFIGTPLADEATRPR